MNVTEPMTPYAFYWILFIFIAILSYSVQGNLNRKFKKYYWDTGGKQLK